MRDRKSDIHRQIGQAKAGRKLGPDEIVHHADEDKANNSPTNLSVKDRAKHSAEHASKAGVGLRKLRQSLRMVREGRKLY